MAVEAELSRIIDMGSFVGDLNEDHADQEGMRSNLLSDFEANIWCTTLDAEDSSHLREIWAQGALYRVKAKRCKFLILVVREF